MADKHPFLSDAWMSEVRKIQERHGEQAMHALHGQRITMNQVVTDIPPEGTTRTFHMKVDEGSFKWDEGEVEGADVTLITDYETAKVVLLGGDPQAGMQAFMQGKIRVTGDMTKLMAMPPATPSADNERVRVEILEITE